MKLQQKNYDVIIIGAGAAGLICAITAGNRGRKILVVDHANKVGKKILMSGGGRCNFTNLDVQSDNYLSHNPHFCKSALSRYTQWDFINLVEKYHIPYHEKTLGQLFCDNKSHDILDMLLQECRKAKVQIRTKCNIEAIQFDSQKSLFELNSNLGLLQCQSVVIASGGLSIPTMGATGFGYEIAQQFNHHIYNTRAGLVPFTLSKKKLDTYAQLAGTSVDVEISYGNKSFQEALLFTHRGLSGPAVLQISSYWKPGDSISINLLPSKDVFGWLKQQQRTKPKNLLKTIFSDVFSKHLSQVICEDILVKNGIANDAIHSLNDNQLKKIASLLNHWVVTPTGTEGYRTAEVTLGGVDTDEISSKTFESQLQSGLYFIGEVLDVSGHLGGYNFQWAWSSGVAAGSYV